MTDTLRTARQLLAELQATETYLRVAAARVLPYAGVLGVERRAARRCAELLDGLGIKLGFDPSDLEPVIVVRALPEAPAATQQAQPRQRTSAGPRVRTARTSSAPPSGSGQVRSRTSARGAEGAGPRPRARTLGRGGDDEDITDAATADGPSPYTRRRRSSSRASSVRASSAKASSAKASSAKASSAKASSAKASSAKASSAKASSAKEPSARSSSASGPVSAARSAARPPAPEVATPGVATPGVATPGVATPGVAPPRASESPRRAPTSPPPPDQGKPAAVSLVSFDEPEDEDALAYVSYDRDGNVEEDASTRAGEPRKANQFTDVGADALVTLDGRTPDLGAALGSSLLDEPSVELEHAPDPDAFEDDAATIVKPSPADSLYGGGRHNTGQGAQAGVSTARASTPAAPSTPPPKRVTSGLYGGSSVPTIRDSKDSSRPRAAAIQLNSGGTGGRVLGLEEEEEPIAVGGADEDHEVHHGGGFSLSLQESEHDDYEDDYEEEEEEPDRFEEEAVIAHAIPVPAGPTPEEIAEIFARAQAAAAAGQLHQGAELYSDVIDADPDHVAAHVARGRLYLDLGDYSRAMSDFIVSEGIAADSPEPQVAIGDLYFARKDYRKAIEYFNAALEMSPNHAMAFCRRGVSHYHRKNYQEALNDLLKAQRIQPDIPNITTYVSMAKKKKGRR